MDRATLSDFLAVLEGTSDGPIRHFSRGEIVTDLREREAYSYGRHFPLFRQIAPPTRRYPRGRYLINGERWTGGGSWGNPSRTHEHQEIVRTYLDSAPTITLPFGALRGAGIDLDSIRALDVSEDTWLELEREARTLAELPLWRRRETYQVTLEAPTLEGVPEKHRQVWRAPTELEREAREARTPETHRDYLSSHDYLDMLPDDDGMYRWTVDRQREVSPDADGIYRYVESVHSLGESVFTARQNGSKRRAKYLSGFDTNESPALYFLAELPTGAPSDIDGARLALAPPAVHAAIARGRIVERQGDVFFIDTDLTRAELETRGAEFARLTLWSLDAKPRKGEVTYRAPLSAKTRARRARREARRRRELWRDAFQRWAAEASYRSELETARLEAREDTRRQWRELEARQRSELERHGPDALRACETCGAGIGEACARIPDSAELERLRGRECHGARYRSTLADLHKSERSRLAHDSRRRELEYPRASSGVGIRRRRRSNLERAAARLETAREGLRVAVFSAPTKRDAYYTPRAALLGRLERARRAYDGALAEYRRELYGGARAQDRDAYRRRAPVALELYRRASDAARAIVRPETVDTGARWQARREAIRSAVSIYGTAHTATELARVRGAVYVRGVVYHRPELERGRFGAPDHRALRLTPERWYLAVRNTVPRARSVDNAR